MSPARRLLLAVGLLLVAGSASAQTGSPWGWEEPTLEDKVLYTTLPFYVSFAGLDAYGTVKCVEAGTCREANPILRPIVRDRGIRVAMGGKLAVQAGIGVGILYLHHRYPQHRRMTALSLLTMTVIQGWVDVRNARVLRETNRSPVVRKP